MPKVMILRNVFANGDLTLPANSLVDLDKVDAEKHVRRGNARMATADEIAAAAPPAETDDAGDVKKGKKGK